MAIKKQFLKSKPVCKVTFTLPAVEAKDVALIGSFNDWNEKATPLKKLKNGSFKTTLDLVTSNSYEFR
jgi:1,4-alpha-glucan branching enzyme